MRTSKANNIFQFIPLSILIVILFQSSDTLLQIKKHQPDRFKINNEFLSELDNDAANFLAVPYELTNFCFDQIVDGNDAVYADNKSANFVTRQLPTGA